MSIFEITRDHFLDCPKCGAEFSPQNVAQLAKTVARELVEGDVSGLGDPACMFDILRKVVFHHESEIDDLRSELDLLRRNQQHHEDYEH